VITRLVVGESEAGTSQSFRAEARGRLNSDAGGSRPFSYLEHAMTRRTDRDDCTDILVFLALFFGVLQVVVWVKDVLHGLY
jgi:hypothetical protein